jgi:hypothetical protein
MNYKGKEKKRDLVEYYKNHLLFFITYIKSFYLSFFC